MTLPAWEDCATGLKTTATKLLDKDWFAYDITTAVSVTIPTKRTFDDLTSIDMSTLRIPLSGLTKIDTPLFSLDEIRIDQSKLNSKLAKEGPTDKSRVSVEYSIMSPSVGRAEIDKGWFYSETANRITLHTPVALSVTIDTWAKDRVQSTLTYDHEDLTLGTPFTIGLHYEGNFPTPGYGKIDTRPFVLENDTAYFNFPFPVFTKDKAGAVTYHEENKEFKIYEVSKTTFYTAYWAVEDNYDFTIDVEALNVIGQDAMKEVLNRQNRIAYDTDDLSSRNDIRDFYRARFIKEVDVTGVLTDLRITDVGDYPLLQRLFRADDAYKRTPFAIHSGWKNFVGQTFPSTVANVYSPSLLFSESSDFPLTKVN